MLWKYFKELFSELATIIFLIVDIVGFIVSSVSQRLVIPREFYGIVTGLGFIIANFQVYSKLQKKIEEYEAQEANIRIKILESKVIIKAPVLADQERVKDGRSGDGLDDYGLPISHNLVAKVDIENTGKESGNLVWELDLDNSELPEFFTVYQNAVNGYFDEEENVRLEVAGRDRYESQWILPLLLKENDPKMLAHNLSILPVYRLLLNYKTKRIGGETPRRTIVIDGNLTSYRDTLILKWKGRQQIDLVEFANGAPINFQMF